MAGKKQTKWGDVLVVVIIVVFGEKKGSARGKRRVCVWFFGWQATASKNPQLRGWA